MAVSSKSQCFSAIIHLKEKDFRERNSGNIGAEKEISCCKFLSVLEGWLQRTAERFAEGFFRRLRKTVWSSESYMNFPVMLAGAAAICSGVPVATIQPPSVPPPGPISII